MNIPEPLDSLALSETASIAIADTSTPNTLQMGFNVRDKYGKSYAYGGIDSGYIERLNHGTTFDGAPIVSHFRTRDIPIGQWQYQAQVRKVKFMAKSNSNVSENVEVTHYGDASFTPTANKNDGKPVTLICPINNLNNRVTRQVDSVGWGDHNFHAFDVTLTSDDSEVALEMIGIAIRYKIIREEMI